MGGGVGLGRQRGEGRVGKAEMGEMGSGGGGGGGREKGKRQRLRGWSL